VTVILAGVNTMIIFKKSFNHKPNDITSGKNSTAILGKNKTVMQEAGESFYSKLF